MRKRPVTKKVPVLERAHAAFYCCTTTERIPLAAGLDAMAGQLAGREQELRNLAATDGLTGMPNRRSFNARLDADWQSAAELEQSIAVLMFDVDFFKLYNTTS